MKEVVRAGRAEPGSHFVTFRFLQQPSCAVKLAKKLHLWLPLSDLIHLPSSLNCSFLRNPADVLIFTGLGRSTM